MSALAALISAGKAPLQSTAQRAGIAEVLGYDLVLTKHIANRDGLGVLASYGQTTNRIRLGTGVYPVLTQSVVTLAQRAITLDELLDGRLVLGLGTSHRSVIEAWHGIAFPDEPLRAMREHVTALRQLFTTGRLDADGEHVRSGFRFRGVTPREDLPIHLAALSPGMLRLAGELADGVMLWLCEPTYIREVVVPSIAEGAERAGRDPSEVEIIAALTCAVTDEPDAAIAAFRRTVVPYLGLPFYRQMLDRAGFADALAAFDEAAPEGDPSAAVPEDLVHALAAIGSAEEVRAQIDRYREAGATLPGIGPLTADGTLSFESTLAAVAGRSLSPPSSD